MMRKRFLSLTCALVLCLSLLPVTALAAAPGGQVIYVGNKNVTNGGYWTTDSDGSVTQYTEEGTPTDNYIHYDAADNTLTLHNATIREYVPSNTSTYVMGAGIGVFNQNDASKLTIKLEGSNAIENVSTGIFVLAFSESTDSSSLTITGSGSLDASGSLNGIMVQSNSGDATLTIQSADVTLTSNSGNGVTVQAGSAGTQGHTATLTVNGGKLTASGAAGIEFNASNPSYNITTELTVSGNALVDTRNGGIEVYGTGAVNTTADDDATNGGIVFDGKDGTVYGNVELQKDLEIKSGETLTIPEGSSLTSNDKLTNNGTVTIENGGTLTDAGTVTNSGTINVEDGGKLEGTPTGGTVVKAPTITTESPLPEGTVGTEYSQTLAAENNPTSWSVTNGTLPAGLTLDTNTGTISGIPTAEGSSAFTVTAENSAGSATQEYTLTIKSVPVASVSLNESNLSLYTGKTATLTATVTPENATNKNVTWSSDKPEVATVENGKVTAKAAGTATITVTTEDGNKTATCTVTVTRPYIPPANPNYRITLEATQGGTVTADPTAAKAGTTVTLTPVPDRGYQVGTVAVTDRFGEPVAVTEQADGTYTFTMPSGQVKVEVTFVESQPEPLPFTDVKEGDWFHDAVRYVYDNGLMDGVGDGQFAPNATTNRAMVVTILYRLAGEPDVSGDVSFTDVEPGLWYTDAVLWAAQKGIVNGISETEFAPSGDLTREQLATVLYRYAESMGYDVSAQADLSGFPDAGDIQDYATEALSWAVAEGLLQGFEDDSLQPGGTATRAQIATILMRFLAAVSAE